MYAHQRVELRQGPVHGRYIDVLLTDDDRKTECGRAVGQFSFRDHAAHGGKNFFLRSASASVHTCAAVGRHCPQPAAPPPLREEPAACASP